MPVGRPILREVGHKGRICGARNTTVNLSYRRSRTDRNIAAAAATSRSICFHLRVGCKQPNAQNLVPTISTVGGQGNGIGNRVSVRNINTAAATRTSCAIDAEFLRRGLHGSLTVGIGINAVGTIGFNRSRTCDGAINF